MLTVDSLEWMDNINYRGNTGVLGMSDVTCDV
jgi:hypothetical protein